MTNPTPAPMVPVRVEPPRQLTAAQNHRLDRQFIALGAPSVLLRIAALDRAPRTEFGAAAIVGGPL